MVSEDSLNEAKVILRTSNASRSRLSPFQPCLKRVGECKSKLRAEAHLPCLLTILRKPLHVLHDAQSTSFDTYTMREVLHEALRV